MEINFYQVEQIEHASIANLAYKILKSKKRLLVFADDEELLNQLDAKFWSFSKTKFLPHAVKGDVGEGEDFKIEDQPVFLTNEECEGSFNQVISFSPISVNFAKKFERIFYFFYDNEIQIARKFYANLQNIYNCKISLYKKDGKEWAKLNNL
jgi:DNA polymerase IIIc chi subunit